MLTLPIRYLGMKATRPGQRPVVLVGHLAADVALKVLEEHKPEFARQVVVGKGLLLMMVELLYLREFMFVCKTNL